MTDPVDTSTATVERRIAWLQDFQPENAALLRALAAERDALLAERDRYFAAAVATERDAAIDQQEAVSAAREAEADAYARGRRDGMEEAAGIAAAFPARTVGYLASAPVAAAEQVAEEIAAAIRDRALEPPEPKP